MGGHLEATGAVVAIEGGQLGHLLLGQLKVEDLNVGGDALLGDALRNHQIAAGHLVLDENLAGVLAVLCGQLPHHRVLQQLVLVGSGVHRRARVAQRRVGGEDDAVVVAVLFQLRLHQVGVEFHLVGHRLDAGNCQQAFQLLHVEVGDADGADEAGVHQVFEGLVRLQVVHVVADDLSISAGGKEVLVLLLKGKGPVKEEQVGVLQLQRREDLLGAQLHAVFAVVGEPDL